MQRVVIGGLLTLALAAGTALAQQQPAPPPQPSAKPPAAATPDPATDSRFKAADKNGNGVLEGAEADTHKGKMTQIDTNKDGKISRDEFAAAAKAGHIR